MRPAQERCDWQAMHARSASDKVEPEGRLVGCRLLPARPLPAGDPLPLTGCVQQPACSRSPHPQHIGQRPPSVDLQHVALPGLGTSLNAAVGATSLCPAIPPPSLGKFWPHAASSHPELVCRRVLGPIAPSALAQRPLDGPPPALLLALPWRGGSLLCVRRQPYGVALPLTARHGCRTRLIALGLSERGRQGGPPHLGVVLVCRQGWHHEICRGSRDCCVGSAGLAPMVRSLHAA